MDEDAFRSEVLAALHGLQSQLREGQERVSLQLAAIVARLDEQDDSMSILHDKVDRLGHGVRDSLEASEQALNSVIALAKRVRRLEFPGG